ncbi:MAG TPA: hypothetical protein VHS58_18675 [Acetobacteraceae bacterium]|jgi:hypothetical protein|nr:hypothetical protein [Acetobacteraceae bacterium]
MTNPAIGSTQDVLARLKAVLPLRWFPDATPVLDGLLTGLASAGAALYGMLNYVQKQARIATVTDSFVDLAVQDYCGQRLFRRSGESDSAVRARLSREVVRLRATRGAMAAALTDLTGRTPTIVEPARAADTGGYGVACGYGAAGAWGSAAMPFQCFVTAYRPIAGAQLPPGAPPIEGSVGDAEILAAVAAVTPAGAIAWTALSN